MTVREAAGSTWSGPLLAGRSRPLPDEPPGGRVGRHNTGAPLDGEVQTPSVPDRDAYGGG